VSQRRNHHAIETAEAAGNSEFQFNYQLDRDGKERAVEIARSRPGGWFHASPMAGDNANPEELDYAVMQISEGPKGISPFRLCPTGVKRDDRVSIIQHPGASYKKISLQSNFVQYADQHVVQYTTSTEAGSSGSPVINDHFKVVALHHAGGELTGRATRRRYLRNEGVRISAIHDERGGRELSSINKKDLSERDICTKYITPAVKQTGWDEMTQAREEVSFTNGRIIVGGKLVTRGKAKRADYVLDYKPNIPIGRGIHCLCQILLVDPLPRTSNRGSQLRIGFSDVIAGVSQTLEADVNALETIAVRLLSTRFRM